MPQRRAMAWASNFATHSDASACCPPKHSPHFRKRSVYALFKPGNFRSAFSCCWSAAREGHQKPQRPLSILDEWCHRELPPLLSDL